MKNRNGVISAVLAIIGLPVVLAAVEAASYHIRNRNNGAIVSSGQKREYLLYVPRSYNRANPTPLVISMHGAGGWPAIQKEISQWNRVAESQGFIAVYPSGAERGGPNIWEVQPGPGLMTDVRFISALIDTLEAVYNIDPTRIYANGLSNGGGMSFVLSCALSDRIAAVGLVASALTLPWNWCTDRRPVPMIAFHGTADPVTPYDGGSSWISPRAFPSIPTWTANWARRNQCATNPVESVVALDVTRLEYKNCAEDAAVTLYTFRGGGHTWPGGKSMPEWLLGPTSSAIDATTRMWVFFDGHRLRAGKGTARPPRG